MPKDPELFEWLRYALYLVGSGLLIVVGVYYKAMLERLKRSDEIVERLTEATMVRKDLQAAEKRNVELTNELLIMHKLLLAEFQKLAVLASDFINLYEKETKNEK